jgi:hypothetical protein
MTAVTPRTADTAPVTGYTPPGRLPDLQVTIPGHLRSMLARRLSDTVGFECIGGRRSTTDPTRLRLAAELLDPTAGQIQERSDVR